MYSGGIKVGLCARQSLAIDVVLQGFTLMPLYKESKSTWVGIYGLLLKGGGVHNALRLH